MHISQRSFTSKNQNVDPMRNKLIDKLLFEQFYWFSFFHRFMHGNQEKGLLSKLRLNNKSMLWIHGHIYENRPLLSRLARQRTIDVFVEFQIKELFIIFDSDFPFKCHNRYLHLCQTFLLWKSRNEIFAFDDNFYSPINSYASEWGRAHFCDFKIQSKCQIWIKLLSFLTLYLNETIRNRKKNNKNHSLFFWQTFKFKR